MALVVTGELKVSSGEASVAGDRVRRVCDSEETAAPLDIILGLCQLHCKLAKSDTLKYFSLSFARSSMSSIQAWRLSYGANTTAMALSKKVPNCSVNNFFYFSLDSTPRVAAVALEVDRVDVGSGATMQASSVPVVALVASILSL
ncbi:hypothetical protein HAX54_003002, partial [Datura stramonium]|nr:hypothetical protein [Datura stramonium]